MKRTDKTEVSKSEYMQMVGLLALAQTYNDKLNDIVYAVMEITGEKDSMGHSSDAVYGDYSAIDLLKNLGITVIKREARK